MAKLRAGMSFKQYLRSEITAGLDETYTEDEAWAKNHPGRGYYDVHLSTINTHERATPIFREYLGGRSGLRILESGCGSGRWMAFFETLGHLAYGVDDSWGPLRLARRHDPDMRLVKADALHTPYADDTFDAAFSSYVAEHFEDGPEELFREIHRVLKPGGFFFVVVPFNNTFRRLVVNPTLRAFYALWHARGKGLGFTEFRYSKTEMDGFLRATAFDVLRVEPDDFFLPWTKGLFVDLCDVGSFVHHEHKPPFEFGPFGQRVIRTIQSAGLWHSCAGIFYVTRARK
jgi:ubiquinone/menaquinone biosynthesis C-methylase UbiE